MVSHDENPANVQLNTCDFHVRIHGLPISMMTKEVASFIRGKIGHLKNFDQLKGSESWGSFMPLRVAIDVLKSLPHALKIRMVIDDEQLVKFMFERLLNFCYLCGKLGHTSKWCETHFQDNFIDPGENTPYGPWLRVQIRTDFRARLPHYRSTQAQTQEVRQHFNSRHPLSVSSPSQSKTGGSVFGEFQNITDNAEVAPPVHSPVVSRTE
ncbi:UNVERIFIED_CONTAM: hypothetical protein Slati_2766600 [Sesamum latifolium]|uniref:CCHC-type domain-containing protein n=1 Tax=Sesamum latifolium TaxID=2727402 RepID=A0AAW2VY98_9LAMI